MRVRVVLRKAPAVIRVTALLDQERPDGERRLLPQMRRIHAADPGRDMPRSPVSPHASARRTAPRHLRLSNLWRLWAWTLRLLGSKRTTTVRMTKPATKRMGSIRAWPHGWSKSLAHLRSICRITCSGRYRSVSPFAHIPKRTRRGQTRWQAHRSKHTGGPRGLLGSLRRSLFHISNARHGAAYCSLAGVAGGESRLGGRLGLRYSRTAATPPALGWSSVPSS